MRDLQELQAYAAEFGKVIHSAQDAAPARAEGSAAGVAHAEVDGTGSPVALRVDAHWEREVPADALGGCLLEAYQTAVQAHMARWSEDLQRRGWKYDAREMEQRIEARTPGESAFQVPVAFGEPRGISQLVTDVLQELDWSHQLASQPVAPAQTQSDRQSASRVSVTIEGDSLASVRIDPEWARGRDADAINGELAAALQSARLRSQPATRLPRADQHDELLGEVLKFLQQHRSDR
ncbi:hypothetical protein [Nocardioides gansuensis]|nr:hypothetical protein [Nocardioides gansuensis]